MRICQLFGKMPAVQLIFDSNEMTMERTPACAELWDFADVGGSESGLSPLL